MPNVERLEIIEFALRLVREEMETAEKLSLKDVAKMTVPYYAEEQDLTAFIDSANEEFYEYHDYA